MSHHILERFNQFPGDSDLGFEACTQGRASMEGMHFGYTIEQPWRNNEPFRSCVPDGDYDLIPFNSPKYGPCFLMVNPDLGVYAFEEDRVLETDRYLCIYNHVANWAKDVKGCSGLGESLGFSKRGYMVTNSGAQIERFRKAVDMTKPQTLSIFTRGPAI